MNVYQFKQIQDDMDILENVIEIRKQFTNYTPAKEGEKPAEKGTYNPFFLDFTTVITLKGKTFKISDALIAKFIWETEQYYRTKLDAMGIEDVLHKK